MAYITQGHLLDYLGPLIFGIALAVLLFIAVGFRLEIHIDWPPGWNGTRFLRTWALWTGLVCAGFFGIMTLLRWQGLIPF